MTRLIALVLLTLSFVAAPPAPLRAEADIPVVAAAADLAFALEEIATRFRDETGMDLRLSFGSTGNFARQIRQAAPFQLFLAADEQFVADLARDGLTLDEGLVYGLGRIALLVPKGGADGALDGLGQALRDGRISRFAIANPEHAPYGKRAEEALRHVGLWDEVQPRLVLGENVAQAAQFVTSGNAEAGIVALSLALAPDVAARSDHVLIPADWHSPLVQRMVLLPDAGPVATAFYAYLQTAPARAVLEGYGFTLPPE